MNVSSQTDGRTVRQVSVIPDYRLSVSFIDGLIGTVDMASLVTSQGAGVFEQLRDPDLFVRVRVEYGAVTWPGDIDLGPDAMYEEIKERGEWKVE